MAGRPRKFKQPHRLVIIIEEEDFIFLRKKYQKKLNDAVIQQIKPLIDINQQKS